MGDPEGGPPREDLLDPALQEPGVQDQDNQGPGLRDQDPQGPGVRDQDPRGPGFRKPEVGVEEGGVRDGDGWEVDLQLEQIRELVERSPKFPWAKYYCKLCKFHLENLLHVRDHVQEAAHVKKMEAATSRGFLKLIPGPLAPHEEAVTQLIEEIALEQGLSEEEELERATFLQQITNILEPFGVFVQAYGSTYAKYAVKSSNLNFGLALALEEGQAELIYEMTEKLKESGDLKEFTPHLDDRWPWLEMVSVGGIRCNLQLMVRLSLFATSRLLQAYMEMDGRVRSLCITFHHLGVKAGFVNKTSGGLPAIALPVMVVRALQMADPPVLPVVTVSKEVGASMTEADLAELTSALESAKKAWSTDNTDSLGSLWIAMLRFYMVTFDVENHVVSIRSASPLEKAEHNWLGKRLTIEDPFNMNRSITKSIGHSKIVDFVDHVFMKMYLYFAIPQMDKGPLYTAFKKTNTVDVGSNQSRVKGCADGGNLEKGKQSDGAKPKGGKKKKAPPPPIYYEKEATESVIREDLAFSVRNLLESLDKSPPDFCTHCSQLGHTEPNCEMELPPLISLAPSTKKQECDVNQLLTKISAIVPLQRSDMDRRKELLCQLQAAIRKGFPQQKPVLDLFGSSVNGLGFRNSDVDLCLTFEGYENIDELFLDPESILSKVKKCVWNAHNMMEDVLVIPTAKVPIVKFKHAGLWLEGDISLYNVLAQRNSKLLWTYVNIDPRTQLLGYAFKELVKRCDISDASRGFLSSYAFTLMTVYYLQQTSPPILPVLQELHQGPSPPRQLVEGKDTYFWSDLQRLDKVWAGRGANRQTIFELWMGLLNFYTEAFDIKRQVVCIRRSKPLLKLNKMWTGPFFAIEDPFNLAHNLGSGLTQSVFHHIMTVLIQARNHFGVPSVFDFNSVLHAYEYFYDTEVLLKGTSRPQGHGCHRCGKIGHKLKDCSQVRSQRRQTNETQRRQRQAEVADVERARRATRGKPERGQLRESEQTRGQTSEMQKGSRKERSEKVLGERSSSGHGQRSADKKALPGGGQRGDTAGGGREVSSKNQSARPPALLESPPKVQQPAQAQAAVPQGGYPPSSRREANSSVNLPATPDTSPQKPVDHKPPLLPTPGSRNSYPVQKQFSNMSNLAMSTLQSVNSRHPEMTPSLSSMPPPLMLPSQHGIATNPQRQGMMQQIPGNIHHSGAGNQGNTSLPRQGLRMVGPQMQLPYAANPMPPVMQAWGQGLSPPKNLSPRFMGQQIPPFRFPPGPNPSMQPSQDSVVRPNSAPWGGFVWNPTVSGGEQSFSSQMPTTSGPGLQLSPRALMPGQGPTAPVWSQSGPSGLGPQPVIGSPPGTRLPTSNHLSPRTQLPPGTLLPTGYQIHPPDYQVPPPGYQVQPPGYHVHPPGPQVQPYPDTQPNQQSVSNTIGSQGHSTLVPDFQVAKATRSPFVPCDSGFGSDCNPISGSDCGYGGDQVPTSVLGPVATGPVLARGPPPGFPGRSGYKVDPSAARIAPGAAEQYGNKQPARDQEQGRPIAQSLATGVHQLPVQGQPQGQLQEDSGLVQLQQQLASIGFQGTVSHQALHPPGIGQPTSEHGPEHNGGSTPAMPPGTACEKRP